MDRIIRIIAFKFLENVRPRDAEISALAEPHVERRVRPILIESPDEVSERAPDPIHIPVRIY